MELNWSTFILEIINFLVLVWILKHFLYQPILGIIARRRAGIDQSLADARDLQSKAEDLQAHYEDRLADWDRERQQARETLTRELDAERVRKLAELNTQLAQEQEKARVAEARRQADALREMEGAALLQGARFATRLLEQGAGPDTETRLVKLVIDELSQLSTDRINKLRNSFGTHPEVISVVSAFPLANDQRQKLEQALIKMTGMENKFNYTEDKKLLAGIRITIGAWLLAANLRDELQGFIDLDHAE